MEFGQEDLSRRVVATAGCNLREIVQEVARLRDVVAVHIAPGDGTAPVPFLEENLQALLARAPGSLQIETLPKAQFKKRMREALERAVATALLLRGRLCGSHVGDAADSFHSFLRELEGLLPFLRSYAWQTGSAGLADLAQKMKEAIDQLAVSAFQHEDNVRCMDDLRYEILPLLNRLQKI